MVNINLIYDVHYGELYFIEVLMDYNIVISMGFYNCVTRYHWKMSGKICDSVNILDTVYGVD